MSKIDIVMKKEESKKNSSPFMALLFLIVGVYGILLFFQSIPGITFMSGVVYPVSAVLCAVLWYSYVYRKRLFPFLSVTILVICLAAAFVLRDILSQQFALIADSILGKTNLEIISATELTLLLAISVSIVLFVFEIILHNHVILFSLIIEVLFLAPLLGIRPGIGAVVLLFFFLITFWALHLSERETESRSLRRKSMQAAAIILAGSLLIVFPLVCYYTQELYDLVFEAEGFVYRTVSRLSGRDSEPITGGQIHSGNNYRTGTGHLELNVSGQPTETLYLRGFGGGEYIGGDWIRSSDEVLFTSIEEKLDWQEPEYRISSMYYGMYFVMNSNMQKEEQTPFSLRIRHLNGEYGNAYVPYYSRRTSGWNHVSGDGTVQDGYIFQYFEQSAMDIKWDNVSADFEHSRDRYMELQDAYMEEIKTAYTQVPVELLPRFKNLVEENPMEGLNEISAFILYTLHSNASYTLTPGWAPFNQDIAEYFLFDSGQGYCEHFALAATLMYRMYGIPARYATGYMVSPSAFELQEDGTWQAIATDEDAHAWTEIFLEDYGWTPVEVTPAADGSTVADYPGFDSMELSRLLSVKNWNMDTPSLAQYEFSLENDAGTVQDLTWKWKFDFAQYEKLLWIAGSVFIYSLFLTPFFLNYRRLRHLKKMEAMNCRRVFYKFMKMLHFAGYFQEYDGSEKEFVSSFTAEIPVISLDEIAQLQNIVCEAAYGFESTAIEKEELVKNIYFRTGSFIYGKLKWNRKLLFRYWHMFG